jgi:hypothetical protein
MPGCPGTAANPQADPGNLCIYESGSSAVPVLINPATGQIGGADVFGALLQVSGPNGANVFGTWAVTA